MSSARAALAFALAAMAVPVGAQQTETPAPAPSRPIDFRLPPSDDDGRSPGVQGPSNNGIAPAGPADTRPTPAPTLSVPRVTLTQPATQPVIQPAPRTPAPQPGDRREAPPAGAARDSGTAAQPATPAVPDASAEPLATAPLQTEAPTTAEAAPVAVADDTSLVPTAPAESGGTPIWAWLLALIAAGGAGYWYWRRRPVPVAEGPAERSAAPAEPVVPAAAPRAPSAPRAAPTPPLAPAPRSLPPVPVGDPVQRAPSPLVTRPAAERRPVVSLALEVRSIRVMPDHVAVAFALNMVNQGTADATGLMVRIALNQGSAMTEPVLARFFDGAGGSVLRDDMVLAVGAGEGLTTEAALPRAIIEPLMIGGKPMLVPVMAFDVTYHWDGDDPDAFGQVAGSFVLGRESGTGGSDKLAPLPLDRASYVVDHPGSRSTAVRRSQ